MARQKPAARQGREYWAAVVSRFEAAPCPHEDFAARQGLNVGTFRSWLYKLRSEQSTTVGIARRAPGFVQVVEATPEAEPETGCTVRVGRAEARFDEAPSAEYLAELLTRAGT